MAKKHQRLKKELGLFDVFAVSTGAMFSSGFFLLPGLASAQAGPSTFLAYILAGCLMLPTVFSMAELSTAMPKAGGSYYFIDRSLGPLMGTIGGLGTWLALIFKSAFALIGMGAYLVIFLDLPVKPVALGLTVAFTLLNIVGVKETTAIQRGLVGGLIAILTLFIIAGLIQLQEIGWMKIREDKLSPFLPFGIENIFYTAGLVFVSYAGLTKIASVSEEVKDPEKNIPRGMLLSLAASTVLYGIGVFILTAVLPPDELRDDLTPIASAAPEVLGWMPDNFGVILIVIAAVAAFASTANAGILSASRYPLAMSRDRLLGSSYKKLGKFNTPYLAVISTAVLMVIVILSFSELGMAKLASSFQLLIFAILNLAVIIMRESRIASYLPGFKSPLYPYVQILGILVSFFLIANMGLISILFSAGVIVFGIAWFYIYGRGRVVREGAIYHIFERLGRDRHKGLEDEFRIILKERGPVDRDVYEDVISHAKVRLHDQVDSFEEALEKVTVWMNKELKIDKELIQELVLGEENLEKTPVFNQIALPHFSHPDIEKTRMVIVRFKDTVTFERKGDWSKKNSLEGIILIAGRETEKSMYQRILSQMANLIDTKDFLQKWQSARNKHDLKECFLHEDIHLVIEAKVKTRRSSFIDAKIGELDLGKDVKIIYIYRDGEIIHPKEDTIIQRDDRLTITGPAEEVSRLKGKYA
ncbi:MAG: amino acid permease [Brumimicrobium sp.]|nr:amino acid permease [Brumimicrobium sp.]